MTLPLSLGAYRLGTRLATPLAGPLLSLRLNNGKEDALRLGERRGSAGRRRGPPARWSGCTGPASGSPSRCCRWSNG